MLAAYNIAAGRAPAGIRAARKWDDGLKAHARAQLTGEPEPLVVWQRVCDYLPVDDHYSGRNRESRQEQHRNWKVSLAFVVSPSGWRTLTEKADDWMKQEHLERERKAVAAADQYQRREPSSLMLALEAKKTELLAKVKNW